jgi:hypothetical protein
MAHVGKRAAKRNHEHSIAKGELPDSGWPGVDNLEWADTVDVRLN